MNKRLLCAALALCLALLPGPALAAGAGQFSDVPAGQYYTDAVHWAVDRGVTTGATETTFAPGTVCTRAQVVTFLWRALGCPGPADTASPFSDVQQPDFYYYEAVLWAVWREITTGATETTFLPGAAVTRGQLVTFLWRCAGRPTAQGGNPFTDVPAGRFYTDAVLWAAEAGVTTGMTATAFAPEVLCTRAQVVTFLWRGQDAIKPAFTQVPTSYFDDALFIGDSRTVGLREFGTLQNADYFAQGGLTAFKVMDITAEIAGLGEVELLSLLQQKQYGKIYIMFGINELPYAFDAAIAKYSELVRTVRALQPDALIFLEANLHIGQERSDRDEIFNNPSLNRFNAAVADMADGIRLFYIDVNEVFDDENGCLRAECTSDGVHLYPKHNADWCAWLCTVGIVR